MLAKICRFISTILIMILIVIAVLLVGPRVVGYQGYAVVSGSMEPNIHVGSIVYDKEAVFDEIEEGNVITYTISGDTLVTHRVISVNTEEETVITKGDANDTEDANPVSKDQIVGTVVYCMPYLGYLAIYAHTKLAIGVICGVIILIILLYLLPEIFKKEEEKEEVTNKAQ